MACRSPWPAAARREHRAATVEDIAFHNVPFLPLSTPKSPDMSQLPRAQVLTTSSSRCLASLDVITVRYHFPRP
jgi:hypothetical protein